MFGHDGRFARWLSDQVGGAMTWKENPFYVDEDQCTASTEMHREKRKGSVKSWRGTPDCWTHKNNPSTECMMGRRQTVGFFSVLQAIKCRLLSFDSWFFSDVVTVYNWSINSSSVLWIRKNVRPLLKTADTLSLTWAVLNSFREYFLSCSHILKHRTSVETNWRFWKKFHLICTLNNFIDIMLINYTKCGLELL